MIQILQYYLQLIKLVEPEEKAQLSNGDMVNGHRQCDDDDNDDDDEWKVSFRKESI